MYKNPLPTVALMLLLSVVFIFFEALSFGTDTFTPAALVAYVDRRYLSPHRRRESIVQLILTAVLFVIIITLIMMGTFSHERLFE